MPSSTAILESLSRSANAFVLLALAWHLVLGLVLAARWNRALALPQRRVALLLILPLASVSGVAWWSRNPFNALLFALLSASLARLALRLPGAALDSAPRWTRAVGALGMVYAAGYPHFVAVSAGWQYLLLAPLGVVPCPSLALLVAGSLLAGIRAPRWSLLGAVAAALYALLGALWLGVWLDLGLLALALALAATGLRSRAAGAEANEPGSFKAVRVDSAL